MVAQYRVDVSAYRPGWAVPLVLLANGCYSRQVEGRQNPMDEQHLWSECLLAIIPVING